MKIICFFIRYDREGNRDSYGLAIFNTKMLSVETTITYLEEKEYKPMLKNYISPFYTEPKYFYEEIENPEYNEDDEDNENHRYIDIYTKIELYKLSQNTLGFLPLSDKSFCELYNYCDMYKLKQQGNSVKKQYDRYHLRDRSLEDT